METVSEANNFEHWGAKNKRHKKQKTIVFWEIIQIKRFVKLPCKLHFVRLAPGLLDKFDNLPMSMKYVCDAVCAELTGDYRPGRADSSDQFLDITCSQEKTPYYGVRVEISF